MAERQEAPSGRVCRERERAKPIRRQVVFPACAYLPLKKNLSMKHTALPLFFRSSLALAAVLLPMGRPSLAQREGRPSRPEAAPALPFPQAAEKVWQTTRDHFYDPKMNGADWNAVHSRLRDAVKSVNNKAELAALLNRMLGELHASHTEYYTDDDFGFYLFPSVMRNEVTGGEAEHIGVLGKAEATGFRITAVLDANPAQRAGIEAGDLILDAEGKPFTTVGSFRGRAGEKVGLHIVRDGKPRTVEVIPVKENLLGAFLRATQKSVKILEIGGKRIGYLHLWTMGSDGFREALQSAVLGKLYATDGLILDIRDGFGGRPFGYSDVFHKPAVVWGSDLRGIRTEQRSAYGKPMILLINGGSRSAKEYFAYEFKKTGRAALVGTTTAGAFLGATGYPIGSEGLLEIPIVGLTLDGKKIEGKGVAPDVEVKPDARSPKQDAQLEKAEAVLLEKIRTAPPSGERETILH